MSTKTRRHALVRLRRDLRAHDHAASLRRCALAVMALASLPWATMGGAQATGERIQLDPFARATPADGACPHQPPPLLDAADARNEAHVRVERGLRCAMDGSC